MISVATDFSRSPAGRFIDDGPNSGERFRRDFLIPALAAFDKIVVEMDGTRGFGSSFLEEAFGGLRRAGYSVDDLLKRITIVSKDNSLKSEVESYWQ